MPHHVLIGFAAIISWAGEFEMSDRILLFLFKNTSISFIHLTNLFLVLQFGEEKETLFVSSGYFFVFHPNGRESVGKGRIYVFF